MPVGICRVLTCRLGNTGCLSLIKVGFNWVFVWVRRGMVVKGRIGYVFNSPEQLQQKMGRNNPGSKRPIYQAESTAPRWKDKMT